MPIYTYVNDQLILPSTMCVYIILNEQLFETEMWVVNADIANNALNAC